MKLFGTKWNLALHTLPIVGVALFLKVIIHAAGYEFLSLSPLVGAIISANVFIIGFLISGVLGDYKESERLPGELACSIEALADEGEIIAASKKSPEAAAFLAALRGFVPFLLDWFHKKARTQELFEKISGFNRFFLAFESQTQANFIARMKQEQSNIRKIVTRIDTLRDTSFNSAGYAIAEIMSVVLCVGLLFIRIEPYYESFFFVGFVTFILIYMVFLIKSLDNPYSYYENKEWVDNVSLKLLHDLEKRLNEARE